MSLCSIPRALHRRNILLEVSGLYVGHATSEGFRSGVGGDLGGCVSNWHDVTAKGYVMVSPKTRIFVD